MSRFSPFRAVVRRHSRGAVIMSAIALVPLIYAGTLISSNDDPTHRLDCIPAAIVDLDRPAVPPSSGASTATPVDLGARLSEELTSDGKSGTTGSGGFDWAETDAATAAADLESGEVLAVLTIPATFSADAVSLGGDPAGATRAELTIETNDGANVIVGNVAQNVGAAIRQSLSDRISADYLQNVYLGFSTLHDRLDGAAEGAGSLKSGADTAKTGADDLALGLQRLQTGSERLETGAAALAEGEQTASDAAARLSTGAADAAAGTGALNDGLARLSAATPTLTSGAASVSRGLDSLLAGYDSLTDEQRREALTQLAAGASTVAAGAASTDAAAQTLDAGGSALVGDAEAGTGLVGLSAGVSELASGTGTLAQSAGSLASGASDVAASVRSAATGATTLDQGVGGLAAGSAELATGLTSARDAVPAYDLAEAEHLSEVASSPVALDATRLNEVPTYGYGLAPYFMALALWVGALAFYLMASPLSARLLASRRPAMLVALRSYLPGVAMALAQSVLMVTIVRFGLDVEAANLPALFGLAALTSLTFVAVNQALIALLGAPGRFVALLLIVVQLASAGGTYPIQTAPGFFQAVHGVLPLTHAVEAFRSLIAGGSIGVAPALAVLMAWLLAGLAVTTIAAARARGATAPATTGPAAEAEPVAA